MTTARSRRAELEASPLRRVLLAVSAVSVLVTLTGFFVAPTRVWGGFLIGFSLVTFLALSGPVFLAFLCMAGARWSLPLERVPAAMASALPLAGALGLLLLAGTHNLYEWSHAAAVEHDPVLLEKAVWLDTTGFAVRLVAVFAVWIAAGRRIVRLSRAWADRPDDALAHRRLRWSAGFIALVAVTFTVASVDWLMSLEPHWFSTMFPLLQFSGMCAAGLAAAVLLLLRHERLGTFGLELRDEHLHDLGKLLFSLTLVWAFCWYCQYMLIWYTNIPEETVHYAARKEGAWWLLVQATLVLQWGVPFVALLARTACRRRRILARVSGSVLAGQVLSLYVQVGPPLMGGAPVLGSWEIAPVAGALAAFFLIADGACLRHRKAPAPDHPSLTESLSYHTP